MDIVARVFAADATPLSDDFLVGGSATVLSAAAPATPSSGSDDEPPLYPSATNVTVSITTTSTSWFPNTTYVPTTLPGGGELIGSVAGDELGRFVVSWKAYVFRASDALYVQHFTVNPPCGDIDDDGEVHATDALLALRASVSLSACTPCICDVSGSNGVTAADALLILQEAVGSEPALDCSACAV